MAGTLTADAALLHDAEARWPVAWTATLVVALSGGLWSGIAWTVSWAIG